MSEYLQINLQKDNEIFTISILPSESNILKKYIKEGFKVVDIY